MTQRLTGHFSVFGLVFFVLKTLLGIARQWSHEKIAILSLNSQSHDRTLVYVGCSPHKYYHHCLYLSLPTDVR